DLTALQKLRDVGPSQVLWELLSRQRSVKVCPKVSQPKPLRNSEKKPHDREKLEPRPIGGADAAESELSPEETAAQNEWSDQQSLLSKFGVLVDEARTYEQDTGVHVLNVGFPLLNVPPSQKSGASRAAAKRVMAPIAFIPVEISIRSGV